MKEQARLVADKKWGDWIPAFAYDLFKGAIWKTPRSTGLARYGKEPSGDDDTRPIGLAYSPFYDGGRMLPVGGSPELAPIGDPDNAPVAFRQGDNTPNSQKKYISEYVVPINTGHTLSAYLYEPSKTQILKLHQYYWGQPGSGALFQIREGKPEIGLLSYAFTEADLAALNVLWAIDDPSLEERADTDELIDRCFDKFESLSFERSTSKSDWYNNLWSVSFIPEDRGYLHVVLEGGDATAIENEAIVKTGRQGILWDNTKVNLFSGGGAFWVRSGYPVFVPRGVAQFGPHREGFYYAGALGDLQKNINGSIEEDQTDIAFEKFDYSNGIDFGFRLTMTATNRRKTPWVYGISARLEPGVRGVTNDYEDPEFDTDDAYEPASPTAPRLPEGYNVIQEIEPSIDGPNNKTIYKVTVADPGGLFTANKALPTDSIARLTLDAVPLMAGGTITEIEKENLRSLRRNVSSISTTAPDGILTFKIEDGWYQLAQYDCDPPPIGDNQRVGYHIRALARTAGFKDSQLAGVNPNSGPVIRGAPLGKDWACRCDNEVKCADAIMAIMESYGLGWRLYFDREGILQFRAVDTTIKAAFSSTGLNNPGADEGRLVILKEESLIFNNENYFNDFVVKGGENGEIVWHMPGSRAILGAKRTKTLTNTGLRTRDEVIYAARSLEWMYGRPGRRALFTTYFNKYRVPGDRITCDGSNWEIDGLSGGSWKDDLSHYLVLEVA